MASQAEMDEVDEESALKSVHVSNPWAFAKINAACRPSGRQSLQSSEPDGNPQLPTPDRRVDDAREKSSPSSPSLFPYPLKARAKRRINEEDEVEITSPHLKQHGRGSLDAWVRKSAEAQEGPLTDLAHDKDPSRGARGPPDLSDPGPFVSARTLPMGTPLSDILDGSQRPHRKAPHRQQHKEPKQKPFVPPTQDSSKVWFDGAERPRKRGLQQGHQRPPRPNVDALNLRDDRYERATPSEAGSSVHPDLAAAMDYEIRKQQANQQHRESLRNQIVASNGVSKEVPLTPSPYKNRQRAAIAALGNGADHTPAPAQGIPSHEFPESLPPEDPRAYLIHLKNTDPTTNSEPRKLKRRKTAFLPFETITRDKYIGDLVQTISTTTPDLSAQIQKRLPLCGFYDDYIHDGHVSNTFDLDDDDESKDEVKRWECTLKAMVKSLYRIEGMSVEEEMEGELDVDLWEILRGEDAGRQYPEVSGIDDFA